MVKKRKYLFKMHARGFPQNDRTNSSNTVIPAKTKEEAMRIFKRKHGKDQVIDSCTYDKRWN